MNYIKIHSYHFKALLTHSIIKKKNIFLYQLPCCLLIFFSGRTEDFFDANIMEQIQYKLIEKHTCSGSFSFSRHITFHSRVNIFISFVFLIMQVTSTVTYYILGGE